MFDYEYWGNRVYRGHTQMAIEEWLLKRAAETQKASVRFYSFPKDAIVLGYAQDTDVVKRLDSADLTRRATGGSHIQVGQNVLAYTFAIPRNGNFRYHSDMRAFYAEGVADALRELGLKEIEADNKASTIMYDGKIIASHAIIWGVKSALMHGLILIDPYDVNKVNERVALAERRIGSNVYSEYAALKNLPAVSGLLNKISPNASEDARSATLKDIIAKAILQRITKGNHKENDVERFFPELKGLLGKKYAHPRWIETHVPTFTQRRIEEIPGETLTGPLKKGLGYCLFLQVENKDFKKMAEPQE